MAATYCLEKKVIRIDDNNSLYIETKSEERYVWEEIYLVNNEELEYIGACSLDNFGKPGWMEYNENYVALLEKEFGYGESYEDYHDDDYGYLGKRIKVLFDIKNKKEVSSKNEVLAIYNKEFNNSDELFYDEPSFYELTNKKQHIVFSYEKPEPKLYFENGFIKARKKQI